MEHKKYYAVKVGIKPGIYETWNECEMQIKGVSGAQYKSFLTLPEAENYINEIESFNSQYKYFRNEIEIENINNQIDNQIENLRSDEVIAFVDGSFNPLEKVSGFGVIIIDNKNVKTSLFKSFTEKDNPDFIELHNVAAELEGVKEAINWAITYNKSYIKIYYDYEGIGKWADESWKANKNITKLYVDFIKEKKSLIDIEFCKVPAHSNVKFNEMADQLAKNSLLQKGYKTYNDGSIYFTDFSIEKWFKIIELLNKEFKEISNENLVKYSITKSDSRQRIEINDSKK